MALLAGRAKDIDYGSVSVSEQGRGKALTVCRECMAVARVACHVMAETRAGLGYEVPDVAFVVPDGGAWADEDGRTASETTGSPYFGAGARK